MRARIARMIAIRAEVRGDVDAIRQVDERAFATPDEARRRYGLDRPVG